MFITGYKNGTWYDVRKRPYEWHHDDPMSLKYVLLWRIGQSKIHWFQHFSWLMWEGHKPTIKAVFCRSDGHPWYSFRPFDELGFVEQRKLGKPHHYGNAKTKKHRIG